MDGFGFGFYVEDFTEPCVYTSILPACNDSNLRSLCSKLKSHLILAHIRAASPGSKITTTNCHPFQFGKILWMHNGSVARFSLIKQQIVAKLSYDNFNQIYGTTDSETCGALFCEFLGGPNTRQFSVEELKDSMLKTISYIMTLVREYEICNNLPHQASSLNFAVTDGSTTIITRFRDHPKEDPPSLYYTLMKSYHITEENDFTFENSESFNESMGFIVCSEPLTYDETDWFKVPKNNMITITCSEYEIEEIPIV